MPGGGIGADLSRPATSDGAFDAHIDPAADAAADSAFDAAMNPPECPPTLPSNGGGITRCGETVLSCRYSGWNCECKEGMPGVKGWWYCNPDECLTAGNGQPCATAGLRCMLAFERDCYCTAMNRWSCNGGAPAGDLK